MAKSKYHTRSITVRFWRMIVDKQRVPLIRFNFKNAHENLAKLDRNNEEASNTYLYKSADEDTYMAWSDLMPKSLRMTVAKKLPNASPTYVDKGVLKVIHLDSGDIVAPTYLVIFPEKSIVGAVSANEGPRMSQVTQYIQNRLEIHEQIDCEPLVRGDIAVELKRIETIRNIELQYHPPTQSSMFDNEPNVDRLQKLLIDMRDAATVTIIISAGKKKGASLSGLRDSLLNWVVSTGARPSKLKVSGPDQTTHKKRTVDLVENELIVTKVVPVQPGEKYFSKEDAYHAIEESYAENLAQFPSVEITGD